MKHIELKGKHRKDVGKNASKKLRKDGFVPCVIYGGEKNINFYAQINEFNHLVFTPHVYLVDIDIEGDKYFCYLQDLQFDPITDKVSHVDFIEIKEDVPVKISIPVQLVGQSAGVLSGGKLIRSMRKLKVKGLAKDLPDVLEVDISHLNIGQNVQVKELTFENLEMLDPSSSVVVMVKSARGVAAGMELEEDLEDEEGEGEGEEGEEGADSADGAEDSGESKE